MFAHKITYTDFDGVEKTETLYFNLTEAEVIQLELTESTGVSGKIRSIVEAKDAVTMIRIFKQLLDLSYGVKRDGRFYKSPELLADFQASAAYNIMFTGLAKDETLAAAFINGTMPPLQSGQPAILPSS